MRLKSFSWNPLTAWNCLGLDVLGYMRGLSSRLIWQVKRLAEPLKGPRCFCYCRPNSVSAWSMFLLWWLFLSCFISFQRFFRIPRSFHPKRVRHLKRSPELLPPFASLPLRCGQDRFAVSPRSKEQLIQDSRRRMPKGWGPERSTLGVESFDEALPVLCLWDKINK